MIFQILQRQGRTMFTGEGRHLLRQCAAIKTFALRLSDLLQGARLSRIAKQLTCARRTALRCKAVGETWLILQLVIAALPQLTNQW